MKRHRRLLLLIPMIIVIFIISGCNQKSSISDKQLVDYYAQSINGLSKVIDGYSQSLETGSNYVNEPATKQIEWIDSTEDKLKQDAPNNKKSKYLYNFIESLEDQIKEYKNNDFSDQESVNNDVTSTRKKFEKSVNVDDSAKVSKAKSKAIDSGKKLQKVLASQPHVDGKKIINSTGEITFNSVKSVPGDQGNKIVEIDYTYKNTTNDDQSANRALIYSGDFTQETDDSVNTLNPGAPSLDWETANQPILDMENDSTLNKLKSGMTKQYVTFIKVDNDSEITFKAKDPGSNQHIGNVKLNIEK